MFQMNLSTDRTPSPFETKGTPLEILAVANRHRQETNARASAEAAIRSLPDDLFADHPDVRQLRVLLRIEEHRAKGATSELANLVGSVFPALEVKVKELNERLEMAALDDAINEDFEFSGVVHLLEEIQHLEHQVMAARIAYGLLSKNPFEKVPYFRARINHARDALSNRLLNLKRDYARAQAEKLEQPAGDTSGTSTAPEGDLHDGA